MIGNIHIMGIVNLNGDSFYAASRTAGADAAARARQMWAEGADVVDRAPSSPTWKKNGSAWNPP